jgi:hypothetical protein
MANDDAVLAGHTYRWTFDGGPTAGETYEHSFRDDGTVVFRDVADAPKADPIEKGVKYASFAIAPGLQLVSYLSEHGYTLTVAMNTASGKLHGFASNDKSWFPLTGTVEAVK